MASNVSGRRNLGDWIALIKKSNSEFCIKLDQIYGDNEDLKARATRMYLRILEEFGNKYGKDRDVIIIRSTGRVNLLGTHIDHRGGSVNPVCIKEMLLVVEPRGDDQVILKNVDSHMFPDEQFRISDCLPPGEKIQDWDTWCYQEFEKRKNDPSVTWSNYVRAAVLQDWWPANLGRGGPLSSLSHRMQPSRAGCRRSPAGPGSRDREAGPVRAR